MLAKGSVQQLELALNDPEASVVIAAANALFQLGDPAAYEVYYAILTGQKKTGDSLVQSQLKVLKDPKALSKAGIELGVQFVPFGGISYRIVKKAMSDAVSPVRAAAMKLIDDPDPKSAEALADTANEVARSRCRRRRDCPAERSFPVERSNSSSS
jgi:HEAT repeat protein